MRIIVKKQHSVFCAIAFEDGKEVARMVALTRRNAKRMLKAKLGLINQTKVKLQKSGKDKTRDYKSSSVMSGLSNVTESRSWKKTK